MQSLDKTNIQNNESDQWSTRPENEIAYSLIDEKVDAVPTKSSLFNGQTRFVSAPIDFY